MDNPSIAKEQDRRKKILEGDIDDFDETDDEDDSIVEETSDDEDDNKDKPVDEMRLTEFRDYSPEEIETFELSTLEKEYQSMTYDKSCIKTPLDMNTLRAYRKKVSIYDDVDINKYIFRSMNTKLKKIVLLI